jgi:uncharacterized protein YyaL (SSP411 family)
MGNAAKQPAAYLYLLSAYDYYLGPVVEITLVGRRDDAATAAMLRAIGRRFIPGLVLRYTQAEQGESRAIAGAVTAHVCANGACWPPVNNASDLEKLFMA